MVTGLELRAACDSHWDDETSVCAATDAGPNETSATAAAAAAAVVMAEDSILSSVSYLADCRRGNSRAVRSEARRDAGLFVEQLQRRLGVEAQKDRDRGERVRRCSTRRPGSLFRSI